MLEMMPTNEEFHKLKQFNLQLDHNQVEIVLGCKISNTEWKSITLKDFSEIFTHIGKQASKISTEKGYLKSTYNPDQDLKEKYISVAKQAAMVAYRTFKSDEELNYKYHFLKSFYKTEDSDDEFSTCKIYEYDSMRFQGGGYVESFA